MFFIVSGCSHVSYKSNFTLSCVCVCVCVVLHTSLLGNGMADTFSELHRTFF